MNSNESFDRTASHMAGEYVSYKELTDEEILDTFNPKFMCDLDDSDVIEFARAILRKAQKK
jgi:hypothetical protein